MYEKLIQSHSGLLIQQGYRIAHGSCLRLSPMSWTRRLSVDLMGQEDFTRGLLIAFSDDAVQKALVEMVAGAVCDPVVQRVTESLKNEVVLLRTELEQRDNRIAQVEKDIEMLTAENDRLEQQLRSSAMRISGIPETPGEDCIAKTIQLFNQDLNVEPPLTPLEVEGAYRVGSAAYAAPNRPRPLYVKLTTTAIKNRICTKRAVLKGTKIFINDDLTKRRTTVFAKARELKRAKDINDCWSAYGRIVIKDKSNVIHHPTTVAEVLKFKS